MAQIILDSNNNLIQGDFDNATLNNRTKLQTTTTNATTNVYVVPNGSSTSAGVSVANNSSLTNASKIVMATNGATDTQIISGINGSGTYLPLSFYVNNALAFQYGTAGQFAVGSGASTGTAGQVLTSGGASAAPTWTTISTTPPTTYGDIGTYVIAGSTSYDTATGTEQNVINVTVAGSTLIRTTVSAAGFLNGSGTSANIDAGSSTSLSLSGTWRGLSRAFNAAGGTRSIAQLWVRIS
jgi:hypothetical protein